jgi:hypothetical protein
MNDPSGCSPWWPNRFLVAVVFRDSNIKWIKVLLKRLERVTRFILIRGTLYLELNIVKKIIFISYLESDSKVMIDMISDDFKLMETILILLLIKMLFKLRWHVQINTWRERNKNVNWHAIHSIFIVHKNIHTKSSKICTHN